MSESLTWKAFRRQYSALHASTLREKSRVDLESRLDVIERILKPAKLADVATTETLHRLQLLLIEGAESRKPAAFKEPIARPRSPHTVRTYMAVMIAALRWAEYAGLLAQAPRFRRMKTGRLRHMKGRPISPAEFQQMLNVAEDVVGPDAVESWRYTIRGLWASGLRLDELLHVHWTDRRYIVPEWQDGLLPVLNIPEGMQKNATEEAIPLLPEFERVLIETPAEDRTGWAFRPMSTQGRCGRTPNRWRVTRERAGRVIGEIGRLAGVMVQLTTLASGGKYASAHDLRRSCADRMIAAGVPEREVSRIMRHASVETTRRYYAPGNVQASAKILRSHLA